jgi:hypothetical protein
MALRWSSRVGEWAIALVVMAWIPSIIALGRAEVISTGRHSRMLGASETAPFVLGLLALSIAVLVVSFCLRNRDWPLHLILWIVAAFIAQHLLYSSAVYYV